MPVLEVHDLAKTYRGGFFGRSVEAVKGVSFAVEPGQLFGVLGPNGAGKTTLVKMLLGIVRPTRGSATLDGCRIGGAASRRAAGYLPEAHRLPPYLTARGVLEFFGRLSGVPWRDLRSRIPALLDQVGLADWANVKCRKFSKGMLQRLGLAQALVHDPRIIFLDEPTDGVDPIGRKGIRDLLDGLKKQGRTVIINSHLLQEVEMVCDRVAIMHQGELRRVGTISEMTASGNRVRIRAPRFPPEAMDAVLRIVPSCAPENGSLVFEVTGTPMLNEVIDCLRSRSILIEAVEPQRSTLEEVFLDVVQSGGPAGDAMKRAG